MERERENQHQPTQSLKQRKKSEKRKKREEKKREREEKREKREECILYDTHANTRTSREIKVVDDD